jgi:hypothetical protein
LTAQTMLTVLTQSIRPRSVRQQSRAIEEAIARVFAPNCEKPPSELRTRIKRLLELDRSIGRTFECPNVKPAGII